MEVSISIPDPDGLNLSGAVPVTVNVSPTTNLSKVEFYVDGVLKGQDTTSPYAFSWDTTTVSDGSHTLKAIAHYKTRKSQSQMAVTVANGVTPPPPPPPPPPEPSGHYYAEHFDGGFNNSFWGVKPGGTATFISDGAVGGALRITNCASASATNHCSGSQSTYGQEGGLSVISLPNDDRPHTGRVPGSGSNCCDGDGAGNVGTWYRFRVRFPTGYKPTPGTQNAIWEMHVDTKTEDLGTPYSSLIGIQGQATNCSCSGSPPWCPCAGTQPRFFYQVPGGPLAQAQTNLSGSRYYPFALNSLLLDHWYDITNYVFWHAVNGVFRSWVDGVKMLDVARPTLYTRPNGTFSYGQSLGLYNYRLWTNFSAQVDFDECVWGPTAASIGVSY